MYTNEKVTCRPDSAVHPIIGLLGLAGFVASLAVMAAFDPGFSPTIRALAVCLSAALPMTAAELLARRGYPERTRIPRPAHAGRVAVKLLGLYVAYGAVALGYWLFPEYAGDFYAGYFHVLLAAWPWLAVLAIPYFLWLDSRMPAPRDGCWHTGMAVLGRWRQVDREILGQFARGWLIKAFFLPLMFVYAVASVTAVLHGIESGALLDANRWYDFLFDLAFLVDLVFVCVGYAMTLRVFDSHIRSAEPTLLGWAVALVCYQPFWSLAGGQYLDYDSDGLGWGTWLQAHTALGWAWPAAILMLLAFYAWATVAFGLRFSNLTHRGILTNGPYRFTKHPAYVAKNLSWWLISVPFITTGSGFEALRHCLLLLLVNGIYYLRARTEERHLAQDPVYIQYALWIEQHGWLRKLGQWWPGVFGFRWRDPAQARRATGLSPPI